MMKINNNIEKLALAFEAGCHGLWSISKQASSIDRRGVGAFSQKTWSVPRREFYVPACLSWID
jgi:hypothetical protein